MGSAAVAFGALLGLAPEGGLVGDESESPSAVPELVSPAADAVSLIWQTPPQCPDEGVLRRALADYLGEEPSVEAGSGVRAEAVVTASEGGLRLSLRTETASGVTTRETTAEDCAVLVDATALIVAIAVDPSGVISRSEQLRQAESPPPESPPPESSPPESPPPGTAVAPARPSEAEPVEPPSTIEPVDSDVRAPEPAEDPRLRFGMRIGGGVDGGSLPDPAGGLRLTGSVIGSRWRAELHGDYWFPRAARVLSGVGGRIGLWTVGARGCGVFGIEAIALEFPVCAGVEGGILRGDPFGDRIVAPETSRQPWFAANGRTGLMWSPRRFIALHVAAELVVPVLRSGFRVGNVEVHRVGAVAGRGLVAVEARFP